MLGELDDQNFEMFAGTRKDLAISVTDGAGDPLVMTGASILWRLCEHEYASALVEKASPEVTINSSIVTVPLQKGDTSSLAGKYYHEVRLTDASSNEDVIAKGWATINPSVTL